MRKLFFLAVALSAAVISSKAQGVRFGIKAGANMGKISGEAFSDEFNLSYHAGAFTEIDFSKTLGIQPELLWSQSKTTTASGGFSSIYTNLNANQQIKLDYLLIPVLLRINVDPLFTLNVGPQFGILIDNHNTVLQNGQNAFKNGDFSMVGGAQLNLKYLRVYGRYIIGLSQINDLGNQDKWQSQQIQLGLGIRL